MSTHGRLPSWVTVWRRFSSAPPSHHRLLSWFWELRFPVFVNIAVRQAELTLMTTSHHCEVPVCVQSLLLSVCATSETLKGQKLCDFTHTEEKHKKHKSMLKCTFNNWHTLFILTCFPAVFQTPIFRFALLNWLSFLLSSCCKSSWCSLVNRLVCISRWAFINEGSSVTLTQQFLLQSLPN